MTPDWVLRGLGLTIAAVEALQQQGLDDRQVLECLKKEAKRRARLLLREHHPDRGGDVQKFKVVNEVFQKLDRLKIRAPEPEPKVRVSVTYYPPQHPQGTCTTATTTTRYYRGVSTQETTHSGLNRKAQRVVFMRPK